MKTFYIDNTKLAITTLTRHNRLWFKFYDTKNSLGSIIISRCDIEAIFEKFTLYYIYKQYCDKINLEYETLEIIYNSHLFNLTIIEELDMLGKSLYLLEIENHAFSISLTCELEYLEEINQFLKKAVSNFDARVISSRDDRHQIQP